MRRDVRPLGDILGEAISDSAGPSRRPTLERLRRAVIGARHSERDAWSAPEMGTGSPVPGPGPGAGDPAGDKIAALVASWSLEAAEQVARAFTVYFHLANLAEEHQRIRILRERDAGQEPMRKSLAAAVAEFGHDAGREHLSELIASLRVHLVLTAHPTEARRRAVVAALRRISGLLDMLDDRRAGGRPRRGAARAARADRPAVADITAAGHGDGPDRRGARGDGGVRRDPVPGGPLRVPGVDRRGHDGKRPDSTAGARLPAVRQRSGADRDGNPFVTARVTRETATIQADHILRALETPRPGSPGR